jgi:hypothetical protein
MATKSRTDDYSKPGGTSGEGEAMGEKTLTITVALPPRDLCGNGPAPSSSGGKIARSKAIKRERDSAHLRAHLSMWSDDPKPYFPTGRVRVDVLVKRDPLWSARRLDDDNLIRGLKATMDGFTDAGVWVDDRQVQWGTIEWEAADPLRGEVVLTLTAAG